MFPTGKKRYTELMQPGRRQVMFRRQLLLAAVILCAQVTASAHVLDHLDFGEQCTVCLVGQQLDHGNSASAGPVSVSPAWAPAPLQTHRHACPTASCTLPGQRAPPC